MLLASCNAQAAPWTENSLAQNGSGGGREIPRPRAAGQGQALLPGGTPHEGAILPATHITVAVTAAKLASPHFMDKKSETQGGVTCPGTHNCQVAELGFEPGSVLLFS